MSRLSHLLNQPVRVAATEIDDIEVGAPSLRILQGSAHREVRGADRATGETRVETADLNGIVAARSPIIADTGSRAASLGQQKFFQRPIRVVGEATTTDGEKSRTDCRMN